MGVRSIREPGDGDGDQERTKRERREVAHIGHLALMKDIEPQRDCHEQEAKERRRRASHEGVEGGSIDQGLRKRVVHWRSYSRAVVAGGIPPAARGLTQHTRGVTSAEIRSNRGMLRELPGFPGEDNHL